MERKSYSVKLPIPLVEKVDSMLHERKATSYTNESRNSFIISAIEEKYERERKSVK